MLNYLLNPRGTDQTLEKVYPLARLNTLTDGHCQTNAFGWSYLVYISSKLFDWKRKYQNSSKSPFYRSRENLGDSIKHQLYWSDDHFHLSESDNYKIWG